MTSHAPGAPGTAPLASPVTRKAWTMAACLLAAVLMMPATSLEGRCEVVKRHVLAVYDGNSEPDTAQTVIHMRAEMVLNHLGYIVEFHDLRDRLPDPGAMSRYAAVITWFTEHVERPADYLTWAVRVSDAGVRFVILGGLGVPATRANLALLNRVLAPIGIRYTSDYALMTSRATVVASDPEIIGFERPLDPVLPPFPIIERISDAANVGLELQASPIEASRRSAVVSTGPGGAFVASGFDIFYEDVLNRSQWLVNPFALFARALAGNDIFPVPDTTTVSGRRLYFSHVDGDGWNNYVEMERYRNPRTTASEVMLAELIEPYRDLPVSVGLVLGDLDPDLGGGDRAAETARKIFALPQVEVASHTNSHPFTWGFYEDYDREAELSFIRPVETTSTGRPGLVRSLRHSLGLGGAHDPDRLHKELYKSGSARDLPRAYLREPFSIETEVFEAVRQTAALAPADKPVALYQWSGDTRPPEAILQATRQAGLRNLNGGDTRFDDEFPSVGYVAPLSRSAGKERQIYAVNSNENTYTSEWTEHYQGLLSLTETLRRTEHPRRLKGVNIYYHTFSAEKNVSLEAVRTLLDWAREQDLAPIPASHYAAIADGFFSSRIERLSPTSWRVSRRDGLDTVRFEAADNLSVDLPLSRGVIGSTRHGGALYVALDHAVEAAVVTLRPRGGPQERTLAALEESRWRLWNVARGDCSLTFAASGYGPGQFVWRGMRPGPHRITVRKGQAVSWQASRKAGPDGVLRFSIPVSAYRPVAVAIGCGPDEEARY